LVPAEGNSYKLIVANESMVHLIENFPSRNRVWYLYEEQFRIPIGHPVKKSLDRRWVWRASDCYIGLLVRNDYGVDDRRYVNAIGRASDERGVAVIK